MADVKLSAIAAGGELVAATDALVTVRSGTTDVLTTVNTYLTSAKQVTTSINSAVSAPVVYFTGTLFTGGTGSTTVPYFRIEPSNAASGTSWSTNGTFVGINAALGFAGRYIDCYASTGASVFSVASTGAVGCGSVSSSGAVAGSNITGTGTVSAGSASSFLWTSSTRLTAPSNGVMKVSNNAQTDFSLLQLGGTTSSFPALKRSGTGIISRLADDSADAPFTSSTHTISADNGALFTNQTSDAGAQTATLTNGPTAGNPAFWLRVTVNGTAYAIPCWTA